MTYAYSETRQFVFTESGQVMFLKIRDRADKLLREAGAVRCQELLQTSTGSNWNMLACVDRMIELGELRELTEASKAAGQDRVFIRP